MLPTRLYPRLLAFNLLLVFLPAAGFLYLDVYERQLLTAQERAMVQQGRLVAAALSDPSGSGGAVLGVADDATPAVTAAASAPAELVRRRAIVLLGRLGGRTEARLRVVDRAGDLLADSAGLIPPTLPAAAGYDRTGAATVPYPVTPETRQSVLYRAGAALYRLSQRLAYRSQPGSGSETYYPPGKPLLGPEIRAALAGRYGAVTRRTGGGQRSLTLYSAIPVRGPGGEVTGAVLVSQSTLRLLAELVEVRLGVFKVFLASLAAAALLSLLIAGTIARPLARLRDEANALVDRRGRLRGSFRGSTRRDEIGDLARALEELTRRLEGHIRFIEGFAADVSHEFKNPLAGIRGAAELAAEVEDPAERQRFLGLVLREVSRMERLLSTVREITFLDARLDDEPTARVDLGQLLPEIVAGAAGIAGQAGRGVRIVLAAGRSQGSTPAAPLAVRAAPERLAQVFENLLDNAVGFSPADGEMTVHLSRDDDRDQVVVQVEDRGPGLPASALDRVFDRFYSDRRAAPAAPTLEGKPAVPAGHTGLGLAIAKAIVEGYGGAITAANRPGGGARFEVRLPALPPAER